MARINSVETVSAQMAGYDSTLLRWVASPPFAATVISTNVTVAGNSTVWQGSSAWQVQVTNTPAVSGNSSVWQGSSAWQVQVTNTPTVTIQGNSTAVISGNSSVWQGSTAWQVQITNTPAVTISGNSTAVIASGNSSVWQGSSAWQVQVTNTPTVTVQGNSTVLQGTSPWAISFPAGNISSAAQTGNSSGLTVRPVWSSTGADQPVRPIFSSTGTDNPVRPVFSSTNTDNPVRAVLSSTAADNPISATAGFGLSGFGSKSGQAATAGDNTIVSSVAAKAIYVYAWTLSNLSGSTVSTAANLVRWLDGSTTEVWRVRLFGGSTSANAPQMSQIAVSPPAYLFKVASASFLNLNMGTSGVNYSVAYWQA